MFSPHSHSTYTFVDSKSIKSLRLIIKQFLYLSYQLSIFPNFLFIQVVHRDINPTSYSWKEQKKKPKAITIKLSVNFQPKLGHCLMHFYVSVCIALRDHKFNELFFYFIIFKRVNVEKVSIFLAIHPLMYVGQKQTNDDFFCNVMCMFVSDTFGVSEMEGKNI